MSAGDLVEVRRPNHIGLIFALGREPEYYGFIHSTPTVAVPVDAELARAIRIYEATRDMAIRHQKARERNPSFCPNLDELIAAARSASKEQ
jgi:hypothetical protein